MSHSSAYGQITPACLDGVRGSLHRVSLPSLPHNQSVGVTRAMAPREGPSVPLVPTQTKGQFSFAHFLQFLPHWPIFCIWVREEKMARQDPS